MRLRFRRARTDRTPRDQVRNVLRREQVEEFRAAGNAHAVDVEEELASEAQPLVDRERAVQVRIVDEALPADRRARLLEIHAHDDEEVVRVLLRRIAQALRIFERRLGVVDRAGSHDDEEPIVRVQHAMDRLARGGDGRQRRGIHLVVEIAAIFSCCSNISSRQWRWSPICSDSFLRWR